MIEHLLTPTRETTWGWLAILFLIVQTSAAFFPAYLAMKLKLRGAITSLALLGIYAVMNMFYAPPTVRSFLARSLIVPLDVLRLGAYTAGLVIGLYIVGRWALQHLHKWEE